MSPRTAVPNRHTGFDDYLLSLGPLAYWKINEAVGASVAVEALGSYHGSYSGHSPTLGVIPGPVGGDPWAQFDGVSQWVDLGASVPASSGAITFGCWTATNDVATVPRVFIRAGAGSTWSWSLSWQTGIPRATLWQGPSSAFMDLAGGGGGGGLRFLIATYDGTTLTLYVDGTYAASTTVKTGTWYEGTGQIALGRQPSPSNYLAGFVGRAFIVNRALSAVEIAGLWALRRYAATSLVGRPLLARRTLPLFWSDDFERAPGVLGAPYSVTGDSLPFIDAAVPGTWTSNRNGYLVFDNVYVPRRISAVVSFDSGAASLGGGITLNSSQTGGGVFPAVHLRVTRAGFGLILWPDQPAPIENGSFTVPLPVDTPLPVAMRREAADQVVLELPDGSARAISDPRIPELWGKELYFQCLHESNETRPRFHSVRTEWSEIARTLVGPRSLVA